MIESSTEKGHRIFSEFIDGVLSYRDVDSHILKTVKEDTLTFFEVLLYYQIDFMPKLGTFISRLKLYDLSDAERNYNEGECKWTKYKFPVYEEKKLTPEEIEMYRKRFEEHERFRKNKNLK